MNTNSPSPLAEALERLRAEVRRAEDVLARRAAEGADLTEQMRLAGDVYTSRAEADRAAKAFPADAHRLNAKAVGEALALAFEPEPFDFGTTPTDNTF
jgi:hypothetical protein